MLKHTPGPWNCETPGVVGKVYPEGGARTICKTPSYPSSEDDGNMRLISAAPDLLQALWDMVRWAEIHGLNLANLIDGRNAECPVIVNARAAIAKAEGGQP